MKIFLLGATGRTGRYVLAQALERGHTVNALVRDPLKVKTAHPGLRLYEGSPADNTILAHAMQGCEAIISTLNISRTSDFPWSPLRTPKDFLSAVMGNIILVAAQQGIRRIVITSAWGVAETRKDIPGWFRWFIENSNIRYPYDDHARQEELLQQSNMEWTAVRPVGLLNGKKPRKLFVTVNRQAKPKLVISRYNLAGFILDVVEKDLYVREKPVVSHA